MKPEEAYAILEAMAEIHDCKDNLKLNVPQLNLVWEEREVIHLLVSEKARSRLIEIMPEQVFSVSFDVEKRKNPNI